MVDIFTNCCISLLIRRKGQNMTVLVTGGCGYIGAHVVHALHQAGEQVVVVDDLSYGKPTRIEGSRLYGMDIAAPGAFDASGLAVAQIVDDNDLFAGLMECVNDMSADVAAAAGDENCHS